MPVRRVTLEELKMVAYSVSRLLAAAVGAASGWLVFTTIFGSSGVVGGFAAVLGLAIGGLLGYTLRIDRVIWMLVIPFVAWLLTGIVARLGGVSVQQLLSQLPVIRPEFGLLWLTPYLVAANLIVYMLVRRLSILAASGVERVSSSCGLQCKAGLGGYTVALAAGLAAAAAASGLFASILSSAFLLAARSLGPLTPLAASLLNLVAFRVILVVVTVYLLYKVLVSLAEPLIYAMLAPPHAVAQLVDSIVEGERLNLRKGRAWHQKLFVTSVSSLLALVAVVVTGAAIDAVFAIMALLARVTAPESYTRVLEAYRSVASAYPIASILLFLATRRLIAKKLREGVMEFKPPKPRLSLLAGIVSAALLLLYAGPGSLLATLACPLAPSMCSGAVGSRTLYAASLVLNGFFRTLDEGARHIAKLIDAIVVQLFTG